MNPVNPVPALAAIAFAVSIASALVRKFPLTQRVGRDDNIDGLRGYLAFFVFVHHGCVWYYYLQTGQWQLPPSNFYAQLGQSSVALFFMITGYLFGSKLLRGREQAINWMALYVSRLLRLWPLYLVAMALVFLLVAIATHGKLEEPLPALLRGIAAWLGFTLYGAPDLNGWSKTVLITAGVTWTLCYECLFYFSLPVLAVAAGAAVPLRFVVFGIAGVACIALALWPVEILFVLPFVSGALTSLLARDAGCRRFARKTIASWMIVACATALVLFYSSAYAIAPMSILAIAFALVACGCDLFGVLLLPASRMLGAMSYGIYLLHGILLFATFALVVGTDQVRSFSPTTYWAIVIAITPILIGAGWMAHRLIEWPAMQFARRWQNHAATDSTATHAQT